MKRVPLKRKPIPRRIKEYLWGFHKGLCWYCARPANHIDHIIAHHYSGDDYILNLAPACDRCGKIKNHRVFCHREAARIFVQIEIVKYAQPIPSTHLMPAVRDYIRRNPTLAKVLLQDLSEQSDLHKEQTPLGGDQKPISRAEALKFLGLS